MLVPTINAIMRSPFWKNTAIIVMYDDSDGWYDHQMSPIVNSSAVLNSDFAGERGSAECTGQVRQWHTPRGNSRSLRLWPKAAAARHLALRQDQFVDHTLTDQSSVLRFIEENWGTGQIGDGSFDQLAGPALEHVRLR